MGIISILSMSYINHTHNKNIYKCGKNPQSARRKSNYHTKCGKNCHKILSVYNISPLRLDLSDINLQILAFCLT